MCKRRLGIGADGIILLQDSLTADFRMRIFNADGSEAEMCGNGIRCLAHFAYHLTDQQESYSVETMNHIHTVHIHGDSVTATMIQPTDIQKEVKISFNRNNFSLHVIDTGVPHAVIFMEDIKSIDIEKFAPPIRYHQFFLPRGVNVDLASIPKDGFIVMRTYERGVEKETLACGTGATAVALMANIIYQLPPPINIKTRSNDILKINFNGQGNAITNISMTGPAQFIYQGQLKI